MAIRSKSLVRLIFWKRRIKGLSEIPIFNKLPDLVDQWSLCHQSGLAIFHQIKPALALVLSLIPVEEPP